MTADVPCYSVVGGAKVGIVNFSWPMARLDATADQLTLTVTFFGLVKAGTYTFQRNEVTLTEHRGLFPGLGRGIRLSHENGDYPYKIIFWCLCKPETVLSNIAHVGMSQTVSSKEPSRTKVAEGFPLRFAPILGLVVVWNVLLGYGAISQWQQTTFSLLRFPFVLFPLVAVFLVFAIALATLRSPAMQKALLRPGHSFGEVRVAFVILAVVTGIMAVALTGVSLLGVFGQGISKARSPVEQTAER